MINAYKYRDVEGWAWIFGRLLVGYLSDAFETPMVTHQLIIPMPTYVGIEGRAWDHTRTVIERAQKEDDRWPFAFDVIRKTGPTPRMVGASWRERQAIAQYQLGPLLEIPDRERVAGKTMLIYDDVFTSGTTLRVVALKLLQAGATAVDGIVLARQPFDS